ncbi:MAG: bifunctional folylpolyglutamate synthase/dihydrofolate synthase [Lentisphaeria bacterium]|nr:bifunctional folylpolyglutamate synthase/dihydrofolate synthase [Lentisphaeria bacterium]
MSELDFLASLEFFGIKLGLHQTEELFRRLGSPQKNLKFIHVAGSNGKGSVCAMLENALRACGMKTGFYSSPHLIHVNERFRINNIPVDETILCNAIQKLRSVAADMAENGMKITYFEATTALAAVLFAEAGCDIVLWETGMGGRLDATNIITPLASVITGISLEHTQYLGDTLEKIASEKAGIIKNGVPVFVASKTPEAAKNVIYRKAAECNSPVTYSEPVVTESCTFVREDLRILQTFRIASGETLHIALTGTHQRENASLVLSVLKYLEKTLELDLQTAIASLKDVQWAGRFQFIPGKHLIVDSAHNPEGIGVLASTLREVFPGKKFHFLFGAFADKDTQSSLKILAPLAHSFTFLEMETMRACRDAHALGDELEHAALEKIPWSCTTLEKALQDPEDLTILCGSLHLCGDALALLEEQKKQLEIR